MNIEDNISSFTAIRLGCWLVKISTLAEQILIFAYNKNTDTSFFKIFYDEVTAEKFIETEFY